MKRFLTVFFLLLASNHWAFAQISDFSAGHMDGGKEVMIRFKVTDEKVTFNDLEFSISLDGGASYQNLLKNFDTSFSPANGVKPGINEFIWLAEVDLPNTFVNPAYIKMRIGTSTGAKADFSLEPGDVPSLLVQEPTPAYVLVQFVSGQTKNNYSSSSETLVPIGNYRAKSIDELVKSIDSNAWQPPGRDDDGQNDTDATFKEQTGITLGDDIEGFKFNGPEFVDIEKPDASKGAPLTQVVDMRLDIKPIENSREPMKEIQVDEKGESLLLNFLLFQDQVIFSKSTLLDTQSRVNFVPVEFNDIPHEPGISIAEEFGTVWNRGDYIVGFYNGNGIYDLAICDDPLVSIAHSDKGEHLFIDSFTGSFGVTANVTDELSFIRVWKAEIGNHDNPLLTLPELKGFDRYLNPRLDMSKSEIYAELVEVDDNFSPNVFGPRNHTNSPAPLEPLLKSGSKSEKYNVVIVGEGYADTAADNAAMQSWIDDKFWNGFAQADIQPSYLNAVNFWFVDVKSQDSGITQSIELEIPEEDLDDYTGRSDFLRQERKDDDTFYVWLVDGAIKDTAFSLAAATWEACWRIQMEGSAGWNHLTSTATSALGVKPDEIWVVQNGGNGGCASTSSGIRILALTGTTSVATLLHEWGHSFGRLSDEYTRPKSYTGGASSSTNIYEDSAWDGTWGDLKSSWKRWIPSSRPLPTTRPDVATQDLDVGMFLGGYYATNGVYRPVHSGRMKSNSPLNSPIGNTKIRSNAWDYREQDFRENFTIDSNGDGLTDILIQDGRQLGLLTSAERDLGDVDPTTGSHLRAESGVLSPTWFVTDKLSGAGTSWEFRNKDNILTGDFNGDKLEDFFVHNTDQWIMPYVGLVKSEGDSFKIVRRYDGSLPSWALKRGDKGFSADVTGDGKAELIIFNGTNWAIPYLGIWKVTEDNRLILHRRFDRFLPGWEMGKNESFRFQDLDGDGSMDIIAINKSNWRKVQIHTYKRLFSGGTLVDRFYGNINNGINWNINRKDNYKFGDWDGDGRVSLAIYNGKKFTTEYLGLWRSSSNGAFSGYKLYSDRIPGWNFRPNDEIKKFNRKGNPYDDLVVFNPHDWGSKEYLGIWRNDGAGNLSGIWQEGWIGGWNLGSVDSFKVVDFRGTSQWDDLFIFNKNWFGLLRGQGSRFALETIYYKWVENHRYHGSNLY